MGLQDEVPISEIPGFLTSCLPELPLGDVRMELPRSLEVTKAI